MFRMSLGKRNKKTIKITQIKPKKKDTNNKNNTVKVNDIKNENKSNNTEVIDVNEFFEKARQERLDNLIKDSLK